MIYWEPRGEGHLPPEFCQRSQEDPPKALRQAIQAVLEQLEQSPSLADISNVKPLTSAGSYYRIRIGDYRLGFLAEGDTITVIRFLHRRDIYRYFP